MTNIPPPGTAATENWYKANLAPKIRYWSNAGNGIPNEGRMKRAKRGIVKQFPIIWILTVAGMTALAMFGLPVLTSAPWRVRGIAAALDIEQKPAIPDGMVFFRYQYPFLRLNPAARKNRNVTYAAWTRTQNKKIGSSDVSSLFRIPSYWNFITEPRMNRGTTGINILLRKKVDRSLSTLHAFSTKETRHRENMTPTRRPAIRAIFGFTHSMNSSSQRGTRTLLLSVASSVAPESVLDAAELAPKAIKVDAKFDTQASTSRREIKAIADRPRLNESKQVAMYEKIITGRTKTKHSLRVKLTA